MGDVSRYIAIHGLSIHYRLALPAGPIRNRVFLLSAPGFSGACWRNLLPELTGAGCLCVVCDMPGFGKGQFNDEIPAEQALRAQFLWGVLDAVDLDRDNKLSCWHMIAHGSACGTIVEMARQQPDSTASLFMVSPMLYSPVPKAMEPVVRSKAFGGVLNGWIRRNVVSEKRFEKLARRVYGKAPQSAQLEQLREPLLRLEGHGDTVRRLLLEGYAVDTAALREMFMPCMILWGGADRLLGGAVPARLRKRDCPNAEYHVLPSAGHCAMETHSRAVCDFLRGWIKEYWE